MQSRSHRPLGGPGERGRARLATVLRERSLEAVSLSRILTQPHVTAISCTLSLAGGAQQAAKGE